MAAELVEKKLECEANIGDVVETQETASDDRVEELKGKQESERSEDKIQDETKNKDADKREECLLSMKDQFFLGLFFLAAIVCLFAAICIAHTRTLNTERALNQQLKDKIEVRKMLLISFFKGTKNSQGISNKCLARNRDPSLEYRYNIFLFIYIISKRHNSTILRNSRSVVILTGLRKIKWKRKSTSRMEKSELWQLYWEKKLCERENKTTTI